MLRAFADRMLLKITAMDDPEDLPGVERAVRTAAVIERLYSRCDRAEQQTPDPQKVRAERAQNEKDAFYAQAALADLLKAGQKRRRHDFHCRARRKRLHVSHAEVLGNFYKKKVNAA